MTDIREEYKPVAEDLQMEYLRVTGSLYSHAIAEDCPVGPLGRAYEGLLQDAVAPQGLHRSVDSTIRALQLVFVPFNTARPESGHLTALQTAVAAALKKYHRKSLQFLAAAFRSLASVEEMAIMVEQSVESHFSAAMLSASNGFGWDDVSGLMEVPELLYDEFIQACVTKGCMLTLYAHFTKAQARCSSLKDEERVTDGLIKWIQGIDLRRQNHRPEKMVLLWLKAIEMLVRQANFGSDSARVARGLRAVVSSADVGGEERDNSRGFFGAFGFGQKSLLSPRFRVLSRCLAAFLESHFADGDYLRAAGKSPGAAGVKKTASLVGMARSKEYVALSEHIGFAHSYARDLGNDLSHSIAFCAALVHRLFPDERLLAVIQ